MVYLVGAGILTRISKDWTWKELFAYSFLIGIGLQSVFMFAIDVLTFQFNAIILFFANFAVLVFCYDSLYDYYTKKEIKLIPASFSLTTVNYTAFLLQAIIFIFVYLSLIHI